MKLTQEQHNILIDWIMENFIPTKTINYDICAYTIHGIFERLYDDGFYVEEPVVIKALQECGFHSKFRDGQCYFNLSRKSRAIQIYRSSLGMPPKALKPEWY